MPRLVQGKVALLEDCHDTSKDSSSAFLLMNALVSFNSLRSSLEFNRFFLLVRGALLFVIVLLGGVN